MNLAGDERATVFLDLGHQADIPADGILSRTIHADAEVKVVLFAFDAGQELSEHTAATPAIIQVLRGEALLTLGDERVEAGPGTWAHMAARLPHAVLARTPMVMLLTMLKSRVTRDE